MPKRQIGLAGAIAIGLASMLGAGVFVVFRDAYKLSEGLLFIAIALAAITAITNATSVYRLAQKVERPGGVYAYSRFYLNDSVSFLAGFAFIFGKIGSIAAISLVFGEYLFPGSDFWPAALSIVVLTVINLLGINRTAGVAAVLAFITVTFLLAVVFSAASNSGATVNLQQSMAAPATQIGLFQILQAAAVIFFAFAGYARVATLGDEVKDPKLNSPRAILITLSSVTTLYFLLAVAMLGTLGSEVGQQLAPVAAAFKQNLPELPNWLPGAVAAIACLGSMLALLAGVSRTAASMAEDRELPKIFESRNRFGAPWLAELAIASGAIALAGIGNLLWVIGFSSFSVLGYYAIGHVASLKQANAWGIQRITAVAGLILCLALAAVVPGPALFVSTIVLGLALVARKLIRRLD